MDNQFKSCPFCGGNNLEDYLDGIYSLCISCHDCPALCVKEKWNTRASQWVSVKDKLPTIIDECSSDCFLVIDKDGHMNVATYWGLNSSDHVGEGYDWFNGDVFVCPTHYMPLPNPPKEQK